AEPGHPDGHGRFGTGDADVHGRGVPELAGGGAGGRQRLAERHQASAHAPTRGVPSTVTPAVARPASALSVVACEPHAASSDSTRTVNPAAAASRAVARTQKSKAMPTTSTAVTPRARNQSGNGSPASVADSNPE